MLANESVAKKFNLQQLIASRFEKADDDFIKAFVREMSQGRIEDFFLGGGALVSCQHRQ